MPADAALIAKLIIDRPLCAACLSQRSGLTVDEIESYLSRIAPHGAVGAVNRSSDRCRACGKFTEVVSMSRTE
jgi:hypothetical protein